VWILASIAAALAAVELLRDAPPPRPRVRPAEEWEPEDVEAWLALIEPFPLGDPSRK